MPANGEKTVIMDDMKLERSLKGIGKACFVDHYKLFRDKSRTDELFVVHYLTKNKNDTKDTAKIRVSFAKGIFNARREKDALKFCVQARIPRKLVDKARMLLNGCKPLGVTP